MAVFVLCVKRSVTRLTHMLRVFAEKSVKVDGSVGEPPELDFDAGQQRDQAGHGAQLYGHRALWGVQDIVKEPVLLVP